MQPAVKVAAFSDVQANFPALQTVVEDIQNWDPDLVVNNGDLVNRGPESLACLTLFEELRHSHNWLPVAGNHEEFVLRCMDTEPASPIEAQLRRFADWTAEQVGDLGSTLRNWPQHLTFAPPSADDWVHVTHGTLHSNRDGVTPSRPDDYLATDKTPDDIEVFITAHTHQPMVRQFGELQVVNTGSVGTPFDGDPRASYARLEYRNGRWHSEIVRLEYDRQRAERDFYSSGFIEQGGPLARIILEEWRLARGMIGRWNNLYHSAVVAGEIDLETAVDQYLRDQI